MGKHEYKRVDVSTLAGLREAERMQRDGWKVIQAGITTVLMERAKTWGASVLAVGAL
jgi:hypothetical protein